MKTIVVIGGIGSGKSSVSRVFSSEGAAYIDLDEVGHDILAFPEVIDKLVEAFGPQVVDNDGSILRREVAARAFVDADSTARLNGITHPALFAEAFRRLDAFAQEGRVAAVVEISPFDGPDGTFSDFSDRADALVAVVAPVETRVARAVAKGYDEADVRNRIARQVSDDEREMWADEIIENTGSAEELESAARAVWADLVSA